MSYVGDSTFAGAAFLVEEEGLTAPTFARRARITRRQSATGGRVVTQVSGYEPAELRLAIVVEAAVWATLLGKVGTSGTLAIVGQPTFSGVFLDALDDPRRDNINGLYFAQATFVGVQ